MQEKFKLFLILFSFIPVFFISGINEEDEVVTFILSYKSDVSDNNKVKMNYLVDIAEEKLMNNFNLIIKELDGEYDTEKLELLNREIVKNSVNAYYLIDVFEGDNTTDVEVKLLDSFEVEHGDFNMILINKDDYENEFIDNETEDEWISGVFNSYVKYIENVEKKRIKRNVRKKITFQHDFPYVNISLSAVSARIYFDERNVVKPERIFSLLPLNIRVGLYPFKFLELGAFYSISYNSMVFKYYDEDEIKYYDVGLVFNYGLFAGVSFFLDFAHYSIGVEFSNMFYDTSNSPDWLKTDDYRSYFIPQLGIYQKIDIKLFKFLHYNIFFNFKTVPQFLLEDEYFFVKNWYDTFMIEISIVGISLVF